MAAVLAFGFMCLILNSAQWLNLTSLLRAAVCHGESIWSMFDLTGCLRIACTRSYLSYLNLPWISLIVWALIDLYGPLQLLDDLLGSFKSLLFSAHLRGQTPKLVWMIWFHSLDPAQSAVHYNSACSYQRSACASENTYLSAFVESQTCRHETASPEAGCCLESQ